GPDAWVTIEEQYEYDGYGNRTATHKLGVTTASGDELHERLSFVAPGASTGGRWLLRAPYRKETWGVDGSAERTDERTYYDGAAFEGLAWGRLERGVVRRTEARRDAGGDYFVQTGRLSHDAHGNVTAVKDPNGHRR